MWNYSEKVFDHFMNPRNVGEIEEADGVGEVGSMACGDALRLTFKLGPDGRIADARFQTFGCGSAIASSSMLTEMIKGKTLEEAARITNEDIAAELGGLPREKMHCSVMGREALEAAMIDYYKRLGRGVPCDLLHKESLLCHCFQVSKDTVRQAIFDHRLTEIEDVTNYTKAGGGCTDCHHDIADLIRDCWEKIDRGDAPPPKGADKLLQLGTMPPAPAPAPAAVAAATSAPAPADASADSAADPLVVRIKELLSNDIAVALRNDGGDIEFVRYQDKKVFVRLTGACAACRASDATIKGFVQSQLREFVDPGLEVIEVNS
ncbi:Fe-S cluster assembly protein NifU [bacterium]|nr:Fe-S cluster assembly protein NifU [bacterium]